MGLFLFNMLSSVSPKLFIAKLLLSYSQDADVSSILSRWSFIAFDAVIRGMKRVLVSLFIFLGLNSNVFAGLKLF